MCHLRCNMKRSDLATAHPAWRKGAAAPLWAGPVLVAAQQAVSASINPWRLMI